MHWKLSVVPAATRLLRQILPGAHTADDLHMSQLMPPQPSMQSSHMSCTASVGATWRGPRPPRVLTHCRLPQRAPVHVSGHAHDVEPATGWPPLRHGVSIVPQFQPTQPALHATHVPYHCSCTMSK